MVGASPRASARTDWAVVDFCPNCGVEMFVGDFPFCPHGRGYSTVVGDEMDHTMTNGTQVPIRFRSKQEFKRWKKENGYIDYVRHIGQDGGDKSKHTTRWATMDQYTLDSVKALLERVASEPARNEPADPALNVRLTTGDLNSPEFRSWRGER